MQNIFIELLPPWVETGLQPAFYDKESGTVLQQVSRMWAKMIELGAGFNKFTDDTTTYVNEFTDDINETVDDYIEKFNDLHDYVEDYFDNLDVQEEINNKLDDMLEQGTLQEIITTYIQSNVAWTFDTVADMKNATNLISGSYAQTLGFHSLNDGGGAIYKISDTGTADEMSVIAVDSLYATIVKPAQLSVKQLGAYGDATHDDTSAIQTALDINSYVYIPDGIYMIDASVALLPNTGNKICLSENATLKAITNNLDRYHIIYISSKNNIEIWGGTLMGDRDTHTGATGEWGYCLKIDGTSDNICIHDINLVKAWGDGLLIDTTGVVETTRVHVDSARRNGYSIIECGGFISTDDIIENTNGTAPQFGVDIEPDLATEDVKNVVFNNLLTKNNTGGGFSFHLIQQNTSNDSVILNDYTSISDGKGIWVNIGDVHTVDIKIRNPYIYNVSAQGIYVKNLSQYSDVLIEHPYVDGYGYGSQTPNGILITGSASSIAYNVTIINPTVINNQNTTATNVVPIRFDVITNVTYKNIKVINPIDIDNIPISFNSLSDNVKIVDELNASVWSKDADDAIGGYVMPSLVKTTNFTATRQIRISGVAKFPIGHKIKFVNDGDYSLKLYFQNQYIYGLSTVDNKTFTCADKGGYLEILRLSDTEWTATAVNGTWTSN